MAYYGSYSLYEEKLNKLFYAFCSLYCRAGSFRDDFVGVDGELLFPIALETG